MAGLLGGVVDDEGGEAEGAKAGIVATVSEPVGSDGADVLVEADVPEIGGTVAPVTPSAVYPPSDSTTDCLVEFLMPIWVHHR